MEDWMLNQGSSLRLGIFFALFLSLAIWEIWKPDHKPSVERKNRWVSNIALVIFNTILIRILFPVTALVFAELVTDNQWGILNILNLSYGMKIILGIILLDFIIYIQHILFHSLPLLWKFHRMHHADLELDVTSGTRFHPIEMIISMGIKFLAIFLLGISPVVVLLFEIILNGMAMFNHSNIYIPKNMELFIRLLFVTPSMHRIHHSIRIDEYNTNYGFNLSIWDRIFGTYKNLSQKNLTLGLPIYRDLKYSRLEWMMAIPFVEEK